MRADLRAPFPYFGGKSRAAHLVWAALGDVANYVEPFFGSGAVLLARPHAPRSETVNDRSRFLANFWRAVKADPDAVAEHADWPVNETDLHARHRWLVAQLPGEFGARMDAEPDYCDARIAGWWAWGQCTAIMGNWLETKGLNSVPQIAGNSVGRGLTRSRGDMRADLAALCDRLRRVRVLCGDFARALSPGVVLGDLNASSPAGVFLDPPYAHGIRSAIVYGAEEDATASDRAREWAIANGTNPRLRIVLAGYEGEHAMPDGWRSVAWKAHGGMGHLGEGRGKSNRDRERLWLSPACLSEHGALFDRIEAADAR